MCFSNWKNALHQFECSSAHSEAVEFVETIAGSLVSVRFNSSHIMYHWAGNFSFPSNELLSMRI